MENFKFVDGRFVSQTFTCECGREHVVPIQEILVKAGAIDEVGEVLDRLHVGKQGLIIADLNTYAAAGEKPIAEEVIGIGKPFYLSWEEQKQQITTIQASWDQIQALRAIAPTFERIAHLQQTVGDSIMPEEIDVDRSLLREALLNAKEIRTHYTILRLTDTLGWLEELTQEVVDEYDFG